MCHMSHLPTIGLAATVTSHVASVTDDTSMGSIWRGIGPLDFFLFFSHQNSFFSCFYYTPERGGERVTCHRHQQRPHSPTPVEFPI